MIRKITEELRRHIYGARDVEAGRADEVFAGTFDACVVGSGPGGSVAAATLAEAGMKVLLVERGPYIPAKDFNFRVLDMSSRNGHVETTSGFRALLYQGNVLGGSSIIYGGVGMKPDDFIFNEWSERSGTAAVTRESLEPHYRHVAEMMSLTPQTKALENASNRIVREMASALGRPEGLVMLSRYTEGCAGVGLCNFGCGLDMKGTMANSFIPAGLATGNLTVLTECEASAVAGGKGAGGFRASGVEVAVKEHSTGRVVRRATVSARRVVVAGGAFFSSGVLLRSRGLPGRERVGRKVYLQPHAQIFAMFDEPVTRRGSLSGKQYLPFNGVPAIYNFTGYLREHGFWWLASILFPANLASFVSNLPPAEHYEIMRRFHHTTSITITLKDDPARSRVVLKDGKPQLDFRESERDIESLRTCFLTAARGFLAVGARRVFLPLLRPPKIEREADLKQLERLKFAYDDLLLYSDHTSGGNPFGADEARGVTDEAGRVFGTENLYVADSSLFPTAPGVNPSWTIMAMSRRVAKGMAG
ncbi:MAG TPA: GMC family oxidoreductase [Pyrinomonadaceae bacterium]|nr:GMC family oxidoreductase [Pyrinomonadaceae bacterium]